MAEDGVTPGDFSAPDLPADVDHRIGGGRKGPVVPGTQNTPLIPVVIMFTGIWFMWFGIHYWRSDVKFPTDPLKAALQGKPLPDNSPHNPDTTGLNGSTAWLGPTVDIVNGAHAAAVAKSYIGQGYKWGGNASKPGLWDCSSFISKVLGQDLSMVLPGNGVWGDPGYPPHSHGPGSTEYMLYGTGVDLKDVQEGDLVVSVEHIGMVTGPGEMVSAMTPQLGTGLGKFPEGFPAGPPVYRRPNYRQGAQKQNAAGGNPPATPAGPPVATMPAGAQSGGSAGGG